MKTILLWDPRFPDRRPARLTVEDTVASAAVRAGVAAAANPAEAGALSAGGALDPTMLTEVVLQHGSGTATRRVFLPYSVVMVGAAAGVLAAIGTPIPGGVTPTPTPTPTPTLTLSSTSPSIASNAASGTLVSNISNVPAGATPTVTPNDGRLVIAGDSSAGWKVVVGMSALSAGTVNFSVAATGATGASGVLTVTAVADAYVANFTNDTFITQPSSMTASQSKGPYWPSIVDLRSFTANPADWAVYYSPDHGTGTEGIWAHFGFGSDPTTAVWLSYDAALAAGRFDSIASKPAGNPIIGGGASNPAGWSQIETPYAAIYDGQMFMTMQMANASGYRYNQATIRTSSTDGLNFVLPTPLTNIFLNSPVTGAPSDGHTGYCVHGLNPFPALVNPATGNPFKYLMYSLGGGTDKNIDIQWGIDDIFAGTPTIITYLSVPAGIVTDAPAILNGKRISHFFPINSIRRIDDNTFSCVTILSGVSSGTVAAESVMCEVFLDKYGRVPTGKPKVMLGIGDTTTRPIGPSVCGFVMDTINNKWVALYHWRGPSDLNRVGMISGPLRPVVAPEKLYADIAYLPEEKVSLLLANGSNVPSALSLAGFGTQVGSGVTGFSTTSGMQSRIYGGPTQDSEAVITYDAGIPNPAQYAVVDVYFDGIKEDLSNLPRKIFAGFATKKGVPIASQTDAIFLSNVIAAGSAALNTVGASSSTGYAHITKGGVDTAKASLVYPGFGVGSATATFNRSFGVRLYPQLNRIMWLGEGGVEQEEFNVPTGWDWSQTLYPFFDLLTTSNVVSAGNNSYNRIKSLTVRRALPRSN